MPDFSLLDNQDQFGNQYYPADDRAVVIEKEIWDEIMRTLLVAVQTDPSTAGNNDIQPEIDTRALTLRSFSGGASDILRIYGQNGALTISVDENGVYRTSFDKNIQIDLVNTSAGVSSGGAGVVLGRNDGAAEEVDSRLGFILFKGNNGTQLRNTAGFTAHADEQWTLTENGTRFAIETVRNGATSRSDALAITGEQDIEALQGELHATKSFAHGVISKSANYTLTVNETVALCDTSSAAFTITLPAASSCVDRLYRVKKKSADINVLTIDGNGAETIDGNASILITLPYQSVDLVSDGTAWYIL